MAYGEIKVDTITFTDGGIDKSVTISGLVQNPTFSGNITVTGTISGNTVRGQTISGVTVTGTTAQFTSGTFTTIAGGVATITSGVFASGNAAGPSVSVGTTTNGIYSPATNQIAIATSGTGRLFVDASGRVIVGAATAAIGSPFEIVSNTNGQGIGVRGRSSDNIGLISFHPNASATEYARIQSNGDSSLSFGTGSSGTERARIDSSGRLLLGNSSSFSSLSVNSVTAGVQLHSIATNNGASISVARFLNDAFGPQLILGKSRNSTVLAGTIVQNGDELGQLVFNGDDNTDLNTLAARIAAFVDEIPGDNSMPGRLVFSTATNASPSVITERMRINSSGRVGIGTSAPQSQLQVLNQIRVSDSTQSQGSLVLGDGGSTSFGVGIARWNGGTNAAGAGGIGYFSQGTSNIGGHYFYAGDAVAGSQTARMVILPGGNVGIGTTTPNALFHVAGVARIGANDVSDAELQIGMGATGNRNAYIDLIGDTTYTDYGLRLIRNNGGANGDSVLTHRGTGTLFIGCEDVGNIGFRINNTERARIDSSGRLGIGTSNPLGNLHIVSSTSTAGWQVRVNGLGLSNESGFYRTASDNYEMVLRNAAGGLSYLTNTGGASSSTLEFVVQGSERARIDSSGRLLVGTSSIVLGSPQTIVEKTFSDIDLFRVQCGATETAGNIAGLSFGHGPNGARPKTAIGAVATGSFGLSNLVFYVDSTADNNSVSSSDEKMRIDTSGRLLVGGSTYIQGNTYTTGNLLNVFGGSGAGPQFSTYSADAFALGIDFSKSRSSSIGTGTIVQNGDALGNIIFNGYDSTSYKQAATITAVVDGTPGANDMPGRLVFSTTADGASSPTERMRITQAGDVGVGVISAGSSIAARLHVLQNADAIQTAFLENTSSSFTGKVLAVNASRNTTNGTYKFISCSISNVAEKFIVFDSGNAQNSNNSYAGISDVKLKENIIDATSQWDDIKALQVRKYNFKKETGQQTHTQIGLVAQEVELVSPGLVSESPDRDAEGNNLGTVTKSVNYSVLYMKAVKALQEAMERIETLEAKVAALERA